MCLDDKRLLNILVKSNDEQIVLKGNCCLSTYAHEAKSMTKTLNVIYGSTKNKKIAVTPTDYNGMLNIHHYLRNDEKVDVRHFSLI